MFWIPRLQFFANFRPRRFPKLFEVGSRLDLSLIHIWRHAPLRQKTEKKETRNRCAILGGIFCRNTVRNVFLAAMCRHKNAQRNERFLIGGGAASIEGGGSAASIEGADAPYGRKVRQPLKGFALTKSGFANASIQMCIRDSRNSGDSPIGKQWA